MAKGIAGAFKKLKKKITLKGAISGIAKIGAALPVVGGVFSAVSDNLAAAQSQASNAQAIADQRVQAVSAGTVQPGNPLATPWYKDPKKLLIVGAIAIGGVWLIQKLIKKAS